MMDSKALWMELAQDRERFLIRARDASAVTVPYLIPPEGMAAGDDLIDTFSSIGARGVNNLASKLLLALFPVDAPFFQYDPNPDGFGELNDEQKNEVTKSLRDREADITRDIEVRGTRVALYEALRHLIVAGNCVLHLPDEGMPKIFSLPEFVVERDGSDRLMELLIAQQMRPEDLPADAPVLPEATNNPNRVRIVTRIKRVGDDEFRLSQEVDGSEIASGSRTVSEDRLPYKVLRLNRISGEDYGRGFVEEHLGDLQSIEGLSQAALEGAAAMAQVRYLVDTAGTTDPEDLNNAPNGSFVPGNESDIGVLRTDKAFEMRAVSETISALVRQIQQSFLLTSGVQRDGERVTATEIASLVRELEGALGGVYSSLTAEVQLPLVRFTESRMVEDGELTELDPDLLRPRIVTGVEALGRSQELTRLQTAAGLLQGIFGPEAGASILKQSSAAVQIFAAAGLDSDKYVKSAEQVAQEQQAAQEARMMETIAPAATREIGQTVRESQAPQ